jgi:hypothetical protein
VPWLRVIYTGASVRGNGGPDLDIYSVSQLDEPGAVSDEDSRTFAISGRSALVYYGLGSILLLGFPIQAFGIVYHRLVNCSSAESHVQLNLTNYSLKQRG